MPMYAFRATRLIAKAFEREGICFRADRNELFESIDVPFQMRCGPLAVIRFISRDDDNDVAARIYSLLCGVPAEKRERVVEACNILNRKNRYLKFYLDLQDSVNAEYDFPLETEDSSVGNIAGEILTRSRLILNESGGYAMLMRAVYTDEPLSPEQVPIG